MITFSILGFLGGLLLLVLPSSWAISIGAQVILPMALLFFLFGFGASIVCVKDMKADGKSKAIGTVFSFINGAMLISSFVLFMFYSFGHK